MKKFILGALVGAGVSFGVTYIIKQKEMDRVLAEQYEDLKEYYESRISEITDIAKESLEEANNANDLSEKIIMTVEDNPNLKRHFEKGRLEDLVAPYKTIEDVEDAVSEALDSLSYPGEDEEEDEEFLEQQRFNNEMKLNETVGTIELIGEDEIGEMPGYDYLSLMYYTDDQTLVDDRVDIVPEVEAILGIGIHSLTHANNGDFVRVRNHRMSADYEVEVIHGSYANLVLGIDPGAVAERHR